jgi:hypothetical protein
LLDEEVREFTKPRRKPSQPILHDPFISSTDQEYKAQYEKELSNRLLSTCKLIWMKYLEVWRSTNNTTCQFMDAFDQTSRTCQCKVGQFAHPLYPTKPLLLAIVYLTLRIERLDITTADIVRWCERGLLPYTNLWECIPDKFKQSLGQAIGGGSGIGGIGGIFGSGTRGGGVRGGVRGGIEIAHKAAIERYRWIFTANHAGQSNASHFITTANLWFHTVHLAQSIHMQIDPLLPSNSSSGAGAHSGTANPPAVPPLNAPLVAYSMIHSLGLPEHVWELYCDLSQVFTLGTPMQGAEAIDQQYTENIMALILICCLLCDNISSWSLLYHQNYDEGLEFYEKFQQDKRYEDEKKKNQTQQRSSSSSYGMRGHGRRRGGYGDRDSDDEEEEEEEGDYDVNPSRSNAMNTASMNNMPIDGKLGYSFSG